MDKPTAIVVGVGAEQGAGGAVCRRFASEGYHVSPDARAKIAKVVGTIAKAGGSAEAVTTKESEVVALFDRAFSAARRAASDLVAFNAGNNKRVEFRDVSAELFEDFWRVGCFAGFLVDRLRRPGGMGNGALPNAPSFLAHPRLTISDYARCPT
jgi:NAD(P)-dependent dehydrogenase (short-subunit alcohol dehydrogenase family)